MKSSFIVAGLLAIAAAAPLYAQGPDTLRPSRDPLPAGRFHFTGIIRDASTESRSLMISADSLPAAEFTVPGSLPYAVPDSIPFDQFKDDGRVEGDLVVEGGLLKIINLQVVGDDKADVPKDTTKREIATPPSKQ